MGGMGRKEGEEEGEEGAARYARLGNGEWKEMWDKKKRGRASIQ